MTRRVCALIPVAAIALTLFIVAAPADAAPLVFTDRATFIAALGATPIDDDFETYAFGSITSGDTLGDFTYTFASTVEPAVVAGGFGGQALGGPFDVFVGGDAVTLSYTSPSSLRAFGADFLYAPSFDTIPADLYQIVIGDGLAAGFVAGSPPLDSAGGTFFLGVIVDAASGFHSVSLQSIVPLDANGDPVLVPAYQVDNLAYAAALPVPEPATLTLSLLGGALLNVRRRRVRQPSNH